jgi:hypothetical protein
MQKLWYGSQQTEHHNISFLPFEPHKKQKASTKMGTASSLLRGKDWP